MALQKDPELRVSIDELLKSDFLKSCKKWSPSVSPIIFIHYELFLVFFHFESSSFFVQSCTLSFTLLYFISRWRGFTYQNRCRLLEEGLEHFIILPWQQHSVACSWFIVSAALFWLHCSLFWFGVWARKGRLWVWGFSFSVCHRILYMKTFFNSNTYKDSQQLINNG